MKPLSSKGEETAERIIAAAGEVFAERGFRGTTIRQITARAGVNLASVNYHFRDKGELYLRVLRAAKLGCGRIIIKDLTGTAEERLRGFIERFVGHLFNPERPAWQNRVLVLEMASPTPALGMIIREMIAPLYRDVRELVREVAGPRASEVQLDLFTMSIFGQCVFYVTRRPIVEHLAAQLGRSPDRKALIADHIGTFSLAALRDFRRKPAAQRQHRRGAVRARARNLVLP